MSKTIGRPTKYNEETVPKVVEYLENYASYGHPLPSLPGLASVLNVSTVTITDWSNDESKPDFLEAIKRLHDSNHLSLLNDGLKGTYNSAITKLCLVKHGYSDKVELTGANDSNLFKGLTVEFIHGENKKG